MKLEQRLKMQLKPGIKLQERDDKPKVKIIDSTCDSYLVEFLGELYKITPSYITQVNPQRLSKVSSIDTVVMSPEIFSRRNDIPKSYTEVMLFSAIREGGYRKGYDSKNVGDNRGTIRKLVETDEALYVCDYKDKSEFLHFTKQLRGFEPFLQVYYELARIATKSFIGAQLETKYDTDKHSAYLFRMISGTNRIPWMTTEIKERIASLVAHDCLLRDLYEKNGKVNSLGRGLFQKVRIYFNKYDKLAFVLAQKLLRKAHNECMDSRNRELGQEDDKYKFAYAFDGWTYAVQDGILQGLNPILTGTKTCADIQRKLEEFRK